MDFTLTYQVRGTSSLKNNSTFGLKYDDGLSIGARTIENRQELHVLAGYYGRPCQLKFFVNLGRLTP